MLYLDDNDIHKVGVDWDTLINVIKAAVTTMRDSDYAQPIKPYLRYKNAKNRIIAMPAYLGGDLPIAGIKWIASFPGNLNRNLPRAHAITVLNEAETGRPISLISASFLSGLRTASVSGTILKRFVEGTDPRRLMDVGIVGFGPIGRLHLEMIDVILSNRIGRIFLYDIRDVDISFLPEAIREKLTVCESWEEAFDHSDIFVTCTVSPEGYISRKPKGGSLHLNVSLRDYKPEMIEHLSLIIVDDWDEVCRENTDIELMHKTKGLQKAGTISIMDAVCGDALDHRKPDDVVMFSPMGMAIFDMAISNYYYEQAKEKHIGISLGKS